MYIVFDIGGTKMRLGVSDDGVTLSKTVVIETPLSYEAGIGEFKRAAESLIMGDKVSAVAGGIAGPFSQKKKVLLRSPNLEDWIDRPLRADLEEFFGTPVYIENDAALAGLGEATRGAGKDFDIVAYITVSTGVGGVRIIKGKIDSKTIGFEPGHQIIDADKSIIPTADGVFIEDYISGKALAKATGKKPSEIRDPKVWDDFAKILAYGLNNVCVFWSPDVIVLGGSMITGNPAIPVDKAAAYLREVLHIYPELPVIKKATLEDYGGLHGALELIKQQKMSG